MAKIKKQHDVEFYDLYDKIRQVVIYSGDTEGWAATVGENAFKNVTEEDLQLPNKVTLNAVFEDIKQDIQDAINYYGDGVLLSLAYNDNKNEVLQTEDYWLLYCVAKKIPYYFHGYPVQVRIMAGTTAIGQENDGREIPRDVTVTTNGLIVSYSYQYKNRFVKIDNVNYNNGTYRQETITWENGEYKRNKVVNKNCLKKDDNANNYVKDAATNRPTVGTTIYDGQKGGTYYETFIL